MIYFIYKVKNFIKHKENIISLINRIPKNPLKNATDVISHTDWNLPLNFEREYFKYIEKEIFEDFSKNFLEKFKYRKLFISRAWFQVYEKNDLHGFHSHGQANFTNVFYVNLPNKQIKTNIQLPNGESLDFEIDEGDILTFPAFLIHESPKNIYEEKKIIISFNSDVAY